MRRFFAGLPWMSSLNSSHSRCAALIFSSVEAEKLRLRLFDEVDRLLAVTWEYSLDMVLIDEERFTDLDEAGDLVDDGVSACNEFPRVRRSRDEDRKPWSISQ